MSRRPRLVCQMKEVSRREMQMAESERRVRVFQMAAVRMVKSQGEGWVVKREMGQVIVVWGEG